MNPNSNSPYTSLTPRLAAAAELVRNCRLVADVGTDHAYLPIALVVMGKAQKAVASDINEGPYLRALMNINANGLGKKITALHTAGLDGIEKYAPTDILICGMGGELIASIIADAPWTKDKSIRLVLQPMTHPEILRAFLLDNGFDIKAERIVKEDNGKIYQLLAAEYRGGTEVINDYTESELLFGRLNIKKGGEVLCELISRHIETLKKIRRAKLAGAPEADVSEEDKKISATEELLNDCKRAL